MESLCADRLVAGVAVAVSTATTAACPASDVTTTPPPPCRPPPHPLPHAPASIPSSTRPAAIIPAEFTELWATDSDALQAIGITSPEDFFHVDRCSISVHAAHTVDGPCTSAIAFPASSPTLFSSFEAPITRPLDGSPSSSTSSSSRRIVIAKCKTLRRLLRLRNVQLRFKIWQWHVERLARARGRIWKLQRTLLRSHFEAWQAVSIERSGAHASHTDGPSAGNSVIISSSSYSSPQMPRSIHVLKSLHKSHLLKAVWTKWKAKCRNHAPHPACDASSPGPDAVAGVKALATRCPQSAHTSHVSIGIDQLRPSPPTSCTSHRQLALGCAGSVEARAPTLRCEPEEVRHNQTLSQPDESRCSERTSPRSPEGHSEIIALSCSFRRKAGALEWLLSRATQHSSNMSERYVVRGTQRFERQELEKHEAAVTNALSVNVAKLRNMARSRRSHAQLFRNLVANAIFVTMYLSAVFLQLNSSNAFSSIAPMRALLTEPQQQMTTSSDFRGFYDIGQPAHWWHWYLNIFSASLRDGSRTAYNGRHLPHDHVNKTNWQNHLLGGWTIQQWRSRVANCPSSAAKLRICPRDDAGDAGAYGAALLRDAAPELQAPFIFGTRLLAVAGRTSSAEGYFVDVPLDADTVNANLRANNWVDSQTRRLRVTLEAWNLPMDQVIVMFWDTEFNTGGHSRSLFSASVVRVHYYDKPSDITRLVYEIIFVVLFVFHLYSECAKFFYAHKYGFMTIYLQSGWNIASHLQLFFCFTCIVMWIDVILSPPPLPDLRQKVATRGFSSDSISDDEFFQLSIVAEKFLNYQLVTSVHMLLLILKILKSLRVDQRLAEITNIITIMAPQLVSPCFTFATIFLLMTYMAHIFFGANLEDWSNFAFAIGSASGTFLGNSDFDRQILIDPFAAQLWHYLFTFLIVFLSINIVVAIVVEAGEVNLKFRTKHPYLEDSIVKTAGACFMAGFASMDTWLNASFSGCCNSFRFQNVTSSDLALYYDFASAALVMLDAADVGAEQEHVSVTDFCFHLEAKGYSSVFVHLVLQNFFECLCDHRADQSALAAAENTASADKEAAPAAEGCVHSSVAAALSRHKEAMLRFAHIQADSYQLASHYLQ